MPAVRRITSRMNARGGPAETIGQEDALRARWARSGQVAAREALDQRAGGAGEGDACLTDEQFLESECHDGSITPCPESRKEKGDLPSPRASARQAAGGALTLMGGGAAV